MRLLYHYPLCPFSRQVRILLDDLQLEYTLVKEEYWLRPHSLLKLNPAATVPVLKDANDLIVTDISAILEYLNDEYKIFDTNLSSKERAKIRIMLSWCNQKFFREVTKIYVDEKIIRLLTRQGSPRTDYLRMAKNNLEKHITYFTTQLKKYGYIAHTSLTVADIALAAHISILDYFGLINWARYPELKEWYLIIKSRPSFRKLLQDYIPGFTPAFHYAELDF